MDVQCSIACQLPPATLCVYCSHSTPIKRCVGVQNSRTDGWTTFSILSFFVSVAVTTDAAYKLAYQVRVVPRPSRCV